VFHYLASMYGIDSCYIPAVRASVMASLFPAIMISAMFHDQQFATEVALFFNVPAFISADTFFHSGRCRYSISGLRVRYRTRTFSMAS